MVQRHNDIKRLEGVLEHLLSCDEEGLTTEVFKDFRQSHIADLLCLLSELTAWRNQAAQQRLSQIIKGTHRIIVEGFSEKSINHAFSEAIEKVTHYFSEAHDISVTVLELIELPKGGYRAALELHVTPFKENETAALEGQYEEIKNINERDYQKRKKHNEAYLEHRVHDHFQVLTGAAPPHIPDYFLINIHDADLLNMMIEKAFFKASCDPLSINNKILVRVIKEEPKNNPE